LGSSPSRPKSAVRLCSINLSIFIPPRLISYRNRLTKPNLYRPIRRCVKLKYLTYNVRKLTYGCWDIGSGVKNCQSTSNLLLPSLKLDRKICPTPGIYTEILRPLRGITLAHYRWAATKGKCLGIRRKESNGSLCIKSPIPTHHPSSLGGYPRLRRNPV
jgi:hypothetical protein